MFRRKLQYTCLPSMVVGQAPEAACPRDQGCCLPKDVFYFFIYQTAVFRTIFRQPIRAWIFFSYPIFEGRVPWDFWRHPVYSIIIFSWAPNYPLAPFGIFFENWRNYSQFKVPEVPDGLASRKKKYKQNIFWVKQFTLLSRLFYIVCNSNKLPIIHVGSLILLSLWPLVLLTPTCGIFAAGVNNTTGHCQLALQLVVHLWAANIFANCRKNLKRGCQACGDQIWALTERHNLNNTSPAKKDLIYLE